MVFTTQDDASGLGLQVGEEHTGLALEARERTGGGAGEMDSQGHEDCAGAAGPQDWCQHARKPHLQSSGAVLASMHVMTRNGAVLQTRHCERQAWGKVLPCEFCDEAQVYNRFATLSELCPGDFSVLMGAGIAACCARSCTARTKTHIHDGEMRTVRLTVGVCPCRACCRRMQRPPEPWNLSTFSSPMSRICRWASAHLFWVHCAPSCLTV